MKPSNLPTNMLSTKLETFIWSMHSNLKTKRDTKKLNQNSSKQARQVKQSVCMKILVITTQHFKLLVNMNLKPETEFSSTKQEDSLKKDNTLKLNLLLSTLESHNSLLRCILILETTKNHWELLESMLLIWLKKLWEGKPLNLNLTHRHNKNFNKQELGMIPEIIQKPLKDIFLSIPMILEIPKCFNKFGDVLFNLLSLMKRIKLSRSWKLFVQNYVKSEHLIVLVNYCNKSIFSKKLLELIVKEEIMKQLKIVQEWSRIHNLMLNWLNTLIENKEKLIRQKRTHGMPLSKEIMKLLVKSSNKPTTGRIVWIKQEKEVLNYWTDTWMSTLSSLLKEETSQLLLKHMLITVCTSCQRISLHTKWSQWKSLLNVNKKKLNHWEKLCMTFWNFYKERTIPIIL